jgi:caa(3)-type oxidase subunit IV
MEHDHSTEAAHDHKSDHAAHAHPNYVKIYFVLLGLLGVSIAGPTLGIKAVTLITAFGIAVIKAYIVAANFMHLKFEKSYIAYLLLTALALLSLSYAGVSPDVMKHRGRQWENVAAQEWSKRALEIDKEERESEHGEHEEH